LRMNARVCGFLLDHFGRIADERESWRVAHPLPEVLLLAVCRTIDRCSTERQFVARLIPARSTSVCCRRHYRRLPLPTWLTR
jgi:hypothetical protein